MEVIFRVILFKSLRERMGVSLICVITYPGRTLNLLKIPPGVIEATLIP